MGNKVPVDIAGLNETIIVGELVAEPDARELPSGSLAVGFSLTVRAARAKTTSVPMVWYDPPRRLHRWRVGDIVVARGSVVRRFYQAGGSLGSSTEVVVVAAELARAASKSARIVTAAADALSSAAAAIEASVS